MSDYAYRYYLIWLYAYGLVIYSSFLMIMLGVKSSSLGLAAVIFMDFLENNISFKFWKFPFVQIHELRLRELVAYSLIQVLLVASDWFHWAMDWYW